MAGDQPYRTIRVNVPGVDAGVAEEAVERDTPAVPWSGWFLSVTFSIRPATASHTAKATKVIEKTYDSLQAEVTTNSLLILIALREKGTKLSEGMIKGIVVPWAKKQLPGGEGYENDLTYRMRFLRTLGLVAMTQDEWALTHLGAAFIQKASTDTLNFRDAFRLNLSD